MLSKQCFACGTSIGDEHGKCCVGALKIASLDEFHKIQIANIKFGNVHHDLSGNGRRQLRLCYTVSATSRRYKTPRAIVEISVTAR